MIQVSKYRSPERRAPGCESSSSKAIPCL